MCLSTSQSTLLLIVPRHQYKITFKQTNNPELLFGYGKKDVFKISIYHVVYGSDVPLKVKELEPPEDKQLMVPTRYKIHVGYCCILAGFLWEIALMHVDKANKHNTLFCATYLSKVLDHFANELSGITEGIESHWQSWALTPLLQHQLYD